MHFVKEKNSILGKVSNTSVTHYYFITRKAYIIKAYVNSLGSLSTPDYAAM